ncbi:integumentary mucin C.1-like isoform X1 [Entelurus aequoreus]|uniref:integumentary mucin C.1-like isoform X1 n=1 Tax=Entelurus aequoreus TaxID=161455 RepID=UPI002B1E71CA|nr:integumentary mucin C.1-like isoform X1 [Entelurus aequoreus]
MLPALLFVVVLTSCVAQTTETTTGIPPTSTMTSTVTSPTSTTTSTVTIPTPPTKTTTVTIPPLEPTVTLPPLEIFAILETRVQSSQVLNVTDLHAVLVKIADLISTTNTSAIVALSVNKVITV